MSYYLETMLMMCARNAVSSVQGHVFIASLPRQPDLDLSEHKGKERFQFAYFATVLFFLRSLPGRSLLGRSEHQAFAYHDEIAML